MPKKKPDNKARKSRKERLNEARRTTLESWFETVREMDAAGDAAKAAPERGACLVKNPLSGESFCLQTTRDTCKALKGAFIGGPCGG